jgi:uncharacterized protein YggE
MGKTNPSVVVSGEAQTQTNEVQFEIVAFDDSIKAARAGKALSESVQKVFDKMKAAVEFARDNGGKAQFALPHAEFPLKANGKVKSNPDVTNAKLSAKRKFTDASFSIINDAIASNGKKLDAIVVQVIIGSEE